MRIIKNLFILFVAISVFWSCSKSDDKESISLQKELNLSKMLNDEGKIEESLTHLETIINSSKLNNQLKDYNYSLDDFLKLAGQDCYYIRDYNKALQYFKRIKDKNTISSLHFDMALCYLVKQEPDNFIKEVSQFNQVNYNTELKKQIEFLVASVGNINDRNASAEDIFKTAWNLGTGLNNHIGCYTLTTLALEKGFDAPRCYYQRGVSASYIGKLHISIYDFSKAILLKNDYADPYYERAICYLSINMREEAANDLNTLIKINPNSFDAHFILGEIYLEQNQLDEAKKEYEIALNLSNENISKKQGKLELIEPSTRMMRAERIYSESKKRLQQLDK